MTRGRRPGSSGTRETILAAARERFAETGFERTTIRAVARTAGVDPALVSHYFGSKGGLFAAAVALPVDPIPMARSVLRGPRRSVGERVVRAAVTLWEDADARAGLLGVVRAAFADERFAGNVREFLYATMVPVIAEELDAERAALRAQLVGSQLLGLFLARHVLKVEPTATLEPEEVVRLVAPTMQRYLVGALPRGASGARRAR